MFVELCQEEEMNTKVDSRDCWEGVEVHLKWLAGGEGYTNPFGREGSPEDLPSLEAGAVIVRAMYKSLQVEWNCDVGEQVGLVVMV